MTAKTMADIIAEAARTSDAAHWPEAVEIALTAAGYGLVADAKREALLHAAEALDLQPPKLRAQYVSTLRLYAFEPWRLETCPSECAATHPGREHRSRAAEMRQE